MREPMTQAQPDNDLLDRIREGDRGAFATLFGRYGVSLVQYATTIVKDADEAQDIVQQLFVQLWVKRAELLISTSLKSYLYRAVHNGSLNKIRQHAVKESYAGDPVYTGGSAAASAAQRMESKEVSEAVERAIAELPEQCRNIFRLSRFEELKYQQIADRMGLSVKTVENQMGKALKHMRGRLKEFMVILFYCLLNL